MRMDSNIRLSRAVKIQGTAPPRKSPTEPNRVNSAKTDALADVLEAMPAVGSERVARARALIRNLAYPPQQVVDQVAESMAMRIRCAE
jgi:hypothetical protein